jgi:DNA polymerase-3 subunit epsilon
MVEAVATRLVAAGIAGPPAVPGVYAFRDAGGGLLYVGSSRDLARRVRSYFAPAHAPSSKVGRIVRLAVRVEWRATGSVLEALVLEARAIARSRPYFNRRLKQPGRHAWVRFDPRDPFPRLAVTRRLDDGPWRHLGPFPGGRGLDVALERLADALGLRTCDGALSPDPNGRACLRLDLGQCSGPCITRCTPGDYGRLVARAIAALGGGDPAIARASGARGSAPPAELPAPVAGALRALRAAKLAPRVLAVVPAVPGPGHRLLAIAGALLRGAVAVTEPARLASAFARATALAAEPVSALVPRAALDEIRVVTGWLASAEGRAATIDLRAGRAAAWKDVVRRVAPGPLFSSAARPASA